MWGIQDHPGNEFIIGLRKEFRRLHAVAIMEKQLHEAKDLKDRHKAYEALESMTHRRYKFPGRARYHLMCNLREAPFLAAAAALLGLCVWSVPVGLAAGAAALFLNAFADLFLSTRPNRLQVTMVGGVIGGGILAGSLGLIIGGLHPSHTALEYSRLFALVGALSGPFLMAGMLHLADNMDPFEIAEINE